MDHWLFAGVGEEVGSLVVRKMDTLNMGKCAASVKPSRNTSANGTFTQPLAGARNRRICPARLVPSAGFLILEVSRAVASLQVLQIADGR